MKQRIITALVALIFFIPVLLLGGYWIDVMACLLACCAISEIFIMKKQILISINF